MQYGWDRTPEFHDLISQIRSLNKDDILGEQLRLCYINPRKYGPYCYIKYYYDGKVKLYYRLTIVLRRGND